MTKTMWFRISFISSNWTFISLYRYGASLKGIRCKVWQQTGNKWSSNIHHVKEGSEYQG